MPRPISRATISSLKATRQAHQIASEILHPHISMSPPPELPKAISNPELGPLVRMKRSLREQLNITPESIVLSIVIILLTAIGLFFLYIVQHSH